MKFLLLPIVFVFFLGLGLKPVKAQTSSDWYMVGANPQRTSWIDEQVNGNLSPEWYTHVPAYISQKTQIIAVDGVLYISAADGMHAYNAANGNELWHFQTDMPLSNSPTVVENTIYFGCMDGRIHSLDLNGQNHQQTAAARAGFQANPIVVNNRIFAGNRDGLVYAYNTDNLNNQQPIWTFDTGGTISQSPAYKDGVIYQASNSMYAYAINAQNGQQIWRSQKFSGMGFHSYWPVITTQNNQDYVIFNSIYPYGNITHEHSNQLYNPLGPYPVNLGPLGTETGPWPSGTETIEAHRASQYYNEYPNRQTYFILNTSNGQEYKYTLPNGEQGPAPVAYAGGDNGTQYPPLISPQGALYQRINHEGLQGISRGSINGWRFGTSIISVPTGTLAIDEPSGHSGGGNRIYYRLMGDRQTGSFDISTPNKDMITYFSQGNTLARKIPGLFTETGWPYAYWKHADQSPPIPHEGKVYVIQNNAIVAFGTNGATNLSDEVWNQMLPSNTGVVGNQIELDEKLTGIYSNLTATNTAWPKLLQQETYYTLNPGRDRAKYFSPLTIAATADNPNSLVTSNDSQTPSFTHQYSSGVLTTRISKVSPSIMVHNTEPAIHLQGSFVHIGYMSGSGIQNISPNELINGSDMAEGWMLIWNNTNTHRWFPILVSFQRRPSTIEFSPSGISINYPSQADHLILTPFVGMSAPLPGRGPTYSQDRSNSILSQWNNSIPQSDITKARALDQFARYFPTAWNESITQESNDFNYSRIYLSGINIGGSNNDWGTNAPQHAIIPHMAALAARNNASPITINNQTFNDSLNYALPFGVLAYANNTNQAILRLPNIATYWQDYEREIPNISETDPIVQTLSQEIQQMVDAGHLRPYFLHSRYGGRPHGEFLDDYYHNPADTISVLLQALPLLPQSQRATTREYIQNEYLLFSPETYVHTGFNSGTRRESHDVIPDLEAVLQGESFHWGPQTQATWTVNPGWNFTPSNFYAIYLYAKEFGNASNIFNNTVNKLEDPFINESFKTSLPYTLNHYLAGHIGFLRLAHLADQNNHAKALEARDRLVKLLLMRFALNNYPDLLTQTDFEYQGYRWIVQRYQPESEGDITFARVQNGTIWSQYELYGHSYDAAYLRSGANIGGAYSFTSDFHQPVIEVNKLIQDFTPDTAANRIADYEYAAPLWHVARVEEGAGEVTLMGLYDTRNMFAAKAQILNATRPELEKYLDVPAVETGDLFYIQNLIATINASDTNESIPGDANGDRIVDGIDYVVWLTHYNQSAAPNDYSVGNFNDDSVVDGLDYVIWLNNYN